jgi:hypothetical protein
MYKCLKAGDGRLHGLRADWDAWLREAEKLYGRFEDRVGESPFYYHEVAAVGFLASAAAMAGFVPLAEYEVIKRGRTDKRAKVDGRADLWFSSGQRSYSFEFKRARALATPKNLLDRLNRAEHDVARIPREEYHYAAGGLIALVTDERRMDVYTSFARREDVCIAYRVGPEREGCAFLYFRLI